MLKLFLVLIGIILNFQLNSAACIDGTLYCFDSNGIRYSQSLIVGQCWRWNKLACEPCYASNHDSSISYDRYLPLCQYFFPGSVKVLKVKSLWEKKAQDIIQKNTRFVSGI